MAKDFPIFDTDGKLSETAEAFNYQQFKEEQYDKLADIVRASLDMKEIYRIIGL